MQCCSARRQECATVRTIILSNDNISACQAASHRKSPQNEQAPANLSRPYQHAIVSVSVNVNLDVDLHVNVNGNESVAANVNDNLARLLLLHRKRKTKECHNSNSATIQ